MIDPRIAELIGTLSPADVPYAAAALIFHPEPLLAEKDREEVFAALVLYGAVVGSPEGLQPVHVACAHLIRATWDEIRIDGESCRSQVALLVATEALPQVSIALTFATVVCEVYVARDWDRLMADVNELNEQALRLAANG